MAMLLALLRELPNPADAEVRSVVLSLGPKATPAAMRGVVTKLSATTREAIRALLITQVQEAIPAARAAIAEERAQLDHEYPGSADDQG